MAMGKRPSVWLKELIGADVDLMLVCGEREARPIRQGTSEKTMSNLLATGRLEFEYIPGLDHGLVDRGPPRADPTEGDRARCSSLQPERELILSSTPVYLLIVLPAS